MLTSSVIRCCLSSAARPVLAKRRHRRRLFTATIYRLIHSPRGDEYYSWAALMWIRERLGARLHRVRNAATEVTSTRETPPSPSECPVAVFLRDIHCAHDDWARAPCRLESREDAAASLEALQVFQHAIMRSVRCLAEHRRTTNTPVPPPPPPRVRICLVSSLCRPVDALAKVFPSTSDCPASVSPSAPTSTSTSTTPTITIVLLAVSFGEAEVVSEWWDMAMEQHHHPVASSESSPPVSGLQHRLIPIPMMVADPPCVTEQKTHARMWHDSMNSYWMGILALVREAMALDSLVAFREELKKSRRTRRHNKDASSAATVRAASCAKDTGEEPVGIELDLVVVHHSRVHLQSMQRGLDLHRHAPELYHGEDGGFPRIRFQFELIASD